MFSFGQIDQLPILFDVDPFLNHLCHEKGCTREAYNMVTFKFSMIQIKFQNHIYI